MFYPGRLWCFTKYDQAIEGFARPIGPKNASTITELCLYESWFFLDKYFWLLPGLKRLHFKKSRNMEWYKKMTWRARKPTSSVIVDGEIWGPEKLKMYQGDIYNTTFHTDRLSAFLISCQLQSGIDLNSLSTDCTQTEVRIDSPLVSCALPL